jgi:exodeoxyribonuclease VII small subunit
MSNADPSRTENAQESGKGEPPDFEAALGELESLVEALEAGELSLAESLDRFKRGVELSRHCHQMLDQARQSVEILADTEDENSAQEFEGSAS